MTLRTLIPAAGVAAVAVLLLLLQGAWSARDSARRSAAASQAQVAAAQAAATIGARAGVAVERARSREVIVTIQAKEAAHEIASLPGADAPIPPGVLDRWAAAVDRLRRDAEPDGAQPAGSGDAARELPPPG